MAPRAWTRVDPAALTAAFYLGVLVNASYPFLRLTSDLANCLTFAALQILPGRLRVAGRASESADRRFALIVGAVFWIPAYIMGCSATSCAVVTGTDSRMFARLHTVSSRAGTVVVYREDFSALDPFSIEVRQECRVLPGLTVVRRLASANSAADAVIDIRADGDVRILMSVTDAEFSEPPEHVAHLRHLCWGPSF